MQKLSHESDNPPMLFIADLHYKIGACDQCIMR